MSAPANRRVTSASPSGVTAEMSDGPQRADTALSSAHALNPHCTIRINGAPHDIATGTSLARLLQQLGHAPAAVATAVDGTFVAREQRASCVLQAGAQVHCFQPIVGG